MEWIHYGGADANASHIDRITVEDRRIRSNRSCRSPAPGEVLGSRCVTNREVSSAGIRGLLEASPDAMVGVDDGGRIVFVNARAEALFGYTRRDLIGEPVDILVPELLRPETPSNDARLRSMGPGLELAGRCKDGTEFPAEISLSAIETEDGLIISPRSATAPIADRPRSSALRTMRSSPIRWTAPSRPGARARSACSDTGEPRTSSGATSRPRSQSGTSGRRARRAGSGRDTGSGSPIRDRCACAADGTLIDVALTVAPISRLPRDIVTGISTVARDITERKRAVEERRGARGRLNQSQRLESLGQLAGGIAHDFNNLLAVILNYASFVAEAIPENETAERDVEQIRIAAERAAGSHSASVDLRARGDGPP